MSAHYPQPRGAFQGYWMVPGGAVPVWLVVEDGVVALLAPGESPTGFVDVFRVPAHLAGVSSAAQRITVTAGGRTYPVLARPLGPVLGAALGVAGGAAHLAAGHGPHLGSTAARAGNVAADASAFARQGGPAFLLAARRSGVRVRRVGYGVLLGVGFVVGLLICVLVTVVTVAVLAQ
ncbi:hypothetical protein [Nocardioides nitrophenolicus]|uniref:hypothetical protein n=1 Tax=Nocardioides nitrophenolicus TaxID=60489 RepID=UPI00195C4ED6|nr:hypothetical protein [Nocardioides nitrophenolicus]MBM7516149.1 hypothetical protein [Nocardioides nitrophenolicus]